MASSSWQLKPSELMPTQSINGVRHCQKNKTQHKRALESAEIGQLLRDVDGHGGNYLTTTLWGSQEQAQFPSAEWATYQQWQSIGAQVRKGEKATQTVFFKPLNIGQQESVKEDGEPVGRQEKPFIARAGNVFNAAQVDGYSSQMPLPQEPIDRHSQSEALITSSGAHIVFGGSKACYIPSWDVICSPPTEAFVSSEAFLRGRFSRTHPLDRQRDPLQWKPSWTIRNRSLCHGRTSR